MHFTTAEISAYLGAWMWPFFRIGAMLLAAPVFGARMVPVRVRIGLALLITVIVAPLLPAAPAVDALSPVGLMITAQQIMIGVCMGFVLHMVFGAMVLAGQTIANSMGLGFASMVDPANGVQVPVVSQYYLILTTLIFLVLNGHLLLIEMVVDSFRTLPIAPAGITRDGLWLLANWGNEMFIGSMMVALPAVIAMMLIKVALGVMTRAAPQLNVFSVGFPVMLLSGFLIVMVTLPDITPQLSVLMNEGFGLIRELVAGGR